MKKQFSLTKEGMEELRVEHDDLVAQRGALAERIKLAREFGDLAENAEYSFAREEQERVEGRISELENILQNGEVIKKSKAGGVISLGATVKLKSKKDNKTKEFQIVGTVEADPLNGKISDESPIGTTLIGQKLGDEVEIKTPAETTTYKITAIS